MTLPIGRAARARKNRRGLLRRLKVDAGPQRLLGVVPSDALR